MRTQEYKQFSLKTHQKNWKQARPNSAEIELTFGCGLHCRHCYTDCYNKPGFLKQELSTAQVKTILRKLRSAGVVWLCLTGGDPLWRADFCRIYAYARELGFLISVYTCGYALTPRVLRLWEKQPPFAVEITLNAVSKGLYERIAQVPGSFSRAMKAVASLKNINCAPKIKTLITRDNKKEAKHIQKFAGAQGLRFSADYDLYPRLDRHPFPLSLRLSWQERLRIAGVNPSITMCTSKLFQDDAVFFRRRRSQAPLFMCTVQHSDTLIVDPYGKAFLCSLLRYPSFDLVHENCLAGYRRILRRIRAMAFSRRTACSSCARREACLNCPGNAFLETGDPQQPSKYYCRLAVQHPVVRRKSRKAADSPYFSRHKEPVCP